MTKLSHLVQLAINQKDRNFIRQLNGEGEWSLLDIKNAIQEFKKALQKQKFEISGRLIGIAIRSSFEWIVSDLAILINKGISLPVPLDFSDDQIKSLLGKVDYCIVKEVAVVKRLSQILPDITLVSPLGKILYHGKSVLKEQALKNELVSKGIIKIIHTSGTTSKPKGVMIYDESVGLLTQNLLNTFSKPKPLCYLSLVPMSLLIEQVLGVYMPLLSGGAITLMPNSMREFGSQAGLASHYLHLIKKANPNFIYLPPKLLEELDVFLMKGEKISDLMGEDIPHIITGGAKVNKALLERLEGMGVTVYEAYGLSENSSVISINTDRHRKVGSVGKPLPGITAEIKEDELCVKSPTLCAGYYSKDTTSCDIDLEGYLHTGDIAHFDSDGYLYITGRKKHVIILSNARNVSPEWVEGIIKSHECVNDIVVFGDGMESLGAVVMPSKGATQVDLIDAMAESNLALPLFARISKFIIVSNPVLFREQYYTVTGRPKRGEIFRDHRLQVFSDGIQVLEKIV